MIKSLMRILVGCGLFIGAVLVTFLLEKIGLPSRYASYAVGLFVAIGCVIMSMSKLGSRAPGLFKHLSRAEEQTSIASQSRPTNIQPAMAEPTIKDGVEKIDVDNPLDRPEQRETFAIGSHPSGKAIRQVIEDQKEQDPLLGPKLGAKEINQRIINGMKGEKGAHIESLLCILGSLAGYACQVSVRRQILALGQAENAGFAVVGAVDGKKYFFGDVLNKYLIEDPHSVWGLAAGAAQAAGAKNLLDMQELAKHIASTVGHAAYGVPRVPVGHAPGDSPINYLRAMWPVIQPVTEYFCLHPKHWPVLYGLAIQEIITTGKGVIDPAVALSIVMESAAPMSHIDLGA